jgi:hypothetical protein
MATRAQPTRTQLITIAARQGRETAQQAAYERTRAAAAAAAAAADAAAVVARQKGSRKGPKPVRLPPGSAAPDGGVKKRRNKPGTVALREIRKLQKGE